MMKKEDRPEGEPAFPTNYRSGMTLRDFFAAQVLAGMGRATNKAPADTECSTPNFSRLTERHKQELTERAIEAYNQADQMMVVRTL